MPYNREDRYTVAVIDLTDDTEVAHTGGQNTQILKPDVGFVYEVINISYQCPAIGTSGTHDLELWYDGDYTYLSRTKSTFAAAISINAGGLTGNSSESPSNVADQLKMTRARQIAVTNEIPMNFIYTNDTDVAQVGTRALKIVVRKYREAIL